MLGNTMANIIASENDQMELILAAAPITTKVQNNTLYILDEPTTGLHPREVELLLTVLNKLIDAGGSVIVIEHNMDVIRQSDFIMELGPEGGKKGGKLLFSGSPIDLSKKKNCPTAPYLKEFFNKRLNQ